MPTVLIANRVVQRNGKWFVVSEEGKNLGGPFNTKAAAEKRLKQVEFFKHNQLQNLTCNFSGSIVRHDQMEGRDYLVAPMVMIVEGVHAGSNGPLFYPAEELAKVPAVWNHKPIVVYHPEMNGQGISACDPDIITSRKVGLIMNTAFDEGKLKAEAWLEESRVKTVDDRINSAIEKNEMMELSTGLFTDNESAEGEWEGRK